MKPKEIFSHTYEVINKARALQILHFGSSWELNSRGEFQYTKGILIDLAIEHVLMKRLNTDGGLTRGRSLSEQQRLIWPLSMLACAETNHIMQELKGV